MVVYREWRRKQGFVTLTFSAPYFDELLARNGGFLPPDIPCHALWHYYGIALAAYDKQQHQPIYEGDTDADFRAEHVFHAIANAHGVSPDEMLKFWPAVELQAKMMGGEVGVLPPKYKFTKKSVQ